MANHLVQPPPIHQQDSDKRRKGIWAVFLLLGSIAAVIGLAIGTDFFKGLDPFAKSPNVRVSQGFEDVKSSTFVSDELKSALASLSQNLQGGQKPPVEAKGQ